MCNNPEVLTYDWMKRGAGHSEYASNHPNGPDSRNHKRPKYIFCKWFLTGIGHRWLGALAMLNFTYLCRVGHDVPS
jgi:hypothetical protein